MRRMLSGPNLTHFALFSPWKLACGFACSPSGEGFFVLAANIDRREFHSLSTKFPEFDLVYISWILILYTFLIARR